MPHVGDILVGRYRIDAPLGAGGSAMVYRAHDLRLRRDVALKILLPNLASDSAVAQRFEREARSLAAVNHPGIVAVYDVEAAEPGTGSEPFFVMELCERGSLGGLLTDRGGRLPPNEAIPAIVDVAGGLASLHARDFVHRDVKPHNILLTSGGAKLGDFGIARTGDATSAFTAPGTAVGTLAYLAPELLAGGEATAASDVYALGVVVYQVLTGQLPRPAGTVIEFVNAQAARVPPPSEVWPELGTFFDPPVAAALAGDPADRPSPMQLGGALTAATADWKRAGGPRASDATATTATTPSVRDGRRPIRLAPAESGALSAPGVPATAQTATMRVRTTRRPPAPTWVSPPRRSRVGPAVAGVMLIALIALVLFILFDGPRLFGGGPTRPSATPARSTGASATPTASPSPSASATASPSPSATPTASPSPIPSPTPAPTQPPTPTPAPTAPPRPTQSQTRVVDPIAARAAVGNIATAIDNLVGQGQASASAADEVRFLLAVISESLDARRYEDAAIEAEDLEVRIGELAADGEMVPSAELLQEVGKLRSTLPVPSARE